MPFKSEKQKNFLFANKPEIAKKWAKKYKKGGSAKNLTVPQMKANAAGMKPVIATKPKGDPTGQGLRGQALTGATIKRARGGTVVKVKPRGFSRMLPSKRPTTKIYRSQGR